MDIVTNSPTPDHCCLTHRVFAMFGDPLFRRAESDGAPVMVVHLGEKEAAIPLGALQREFGIADDSDDGRMLGLIAQSLDFVGGLHIGDPLPPEVLSGEASWEPDEVHLQIADDAARRQQVQQAFAKAAKVLGLPVSQAVIHLVEELAQELAYIEALRDRLLRRVKAMAEKRNCVAHAYHGDASHLETLTQVRRLAATALKQIGHRFDELDAETGEVMAALRNSESQRTFIRSNRDWLYRTQRAWQPLLLEWDAAAIGFDDGVQLLLNRTYQFLAPRFMP